MPKPIQTFEFTLIGRRIPGWSPSVLLDVGANVGQSALGFAAAFPKATIHSFEPFPDTYRILLANTDHLENVFAHRFGLGRADSVMQMTESEFSTQNHLLRFDSEVENTIDVDIRQGAGLLDKLGIDHVSYLKIDTEGHDLEVLGGLVTALPRIDFIQVEAGMNAYNKTHVPFQVLATFMQTNDFLLFHIFEQVFEFKLSGRPVLRRANPVFINARLVDLAGID
ncbi:MAG: FkbM family methyltransferase [Cypionkella sp.]